MAEARRNTSKKASPARGCLLYTSVFPEYSFEWLESEFDTIATRSADPFYISEQTKQTLHEVYKYWKGKTTSELATSYMAPEAQRAIEHNIFTPGNYFYNGIGHVTVQYDEVLAVGYSGIIARTKEELAKCDPSDADYAKRTAFLEAAIMSCEAAVTYAQRYAKLALQQAEECADPVRKNELLLIAYNCANCLLYTSSPQPIIGCISMLRVTLKKNVNEFLTDLQ